MTSCFVLSHEKNVTRKKKNCYIIDKKIETHSINFAEYYFSLFSVSLLPKTILSIFTIQQIVFVAPY